MQFGGKKKSKRTINNGESDKPDLIKRVDFGFTDEEREMLQNININNDVKSIADCYDEGIEDKINKHFKDLGNDNYEEITNIIMEKIIKRALKDSGEESCIIWIRSTISNITKYFRWHRDGRYFNVDHNKPIYKLAVTLKGNSTPLIVDKKTIEIFDKKYNHDNIVKLRNQFTELFGEPKDRIDKLTVQMKLNDVIDIQSTQDIGDNYITAEQMEGIYFLNSINNNIDNGAIHSEPLEQKDRIFISVLCGTKEDCCSWTKNGRVVRKN